MLMCKYSNQLEFVSQQKLLYFSDLSEEELPVYEMIEDEDEETEDTGTASARPRRMSEINIKEKVKPIPNASAFFIFGPNNL